MRSGLLIALSWVYSCCALAQAGGLEITVGNFEEAKGSLIVAVINNADTWLKTSPDQSPFADAMVAVESTDDITVSIDDLPAGVYAVSVFQDLNENGELDTNFVGYPKEPFGFSAPMGKFGPPKFDKASFTIEAGTTKKIAIELK